MKTISKPLRRNQLHLTQNKPQPLKRQLRDIHKTLQNERVSNEYKTIYRSKRDQSCYSSLGKSTSRPYQYRLKLRPKKKISQGNNAWKLNSQMNSNQIVKNKNIFVSVDNLNKINNDTMKEKSKRSFISHNPKNQQERSQDTPIRNTIKKPWNCTLIRSSMKQINENKIIPHERPASKYKMSQQNHKKTNLRYSPQQKVVNYNNLSHRQQQSFNEMKQWITKIRFIQGYKKNHLLGTGGFSMVWEAIQIKTKKKVAVKHILTQNKYQTHLKQIWFGNYFFANGKPRKEFKYHPGIDNLLTMYEFKIQELDTWLVYELCDNSLGGMLYDLHRDQDNTQEQVLIIRYRPFYQKMKQSVVHLKNIIIDMAKTLDLLASHNIVHSDIKTQNILIKQKKKSAVKSVYQYKLIDYGSSFLFTNLKQYSLATPQYMAPQLLNFISYINQQPYDKQTLKLLKSYDNISAIDIWSLGCVILQIINGLPLWITGRAKIYSFNGIFQKIGIFSVPDRNFKKIIDKQLNVVNNLDKFFKNHNYSSVALDDEITHIVKRMLDLNPATRITPRQILQYFKITIQKPKGILVTFDNEIQ